MKEFKLEETLESVEGKEFLHGISGTVAIAIPAGDSNTNRTIKIHGFGVIMKNDANLTDKVDMLATVLVVQDETAVAVDVPIMEVVNKPLPVAGNFEFEAFVSITAAGAEQDGYFKRTFSKQNNETEIETSTGSGGSIIGSEYPVNIRFKHSQKSKPQSVVKLKGLTVEVI